MIRHKILLWRCLPMEADNCLGKEGDKCIFFFEMLSAAPTGLPGAVVGRSSDEGWRHKQRQNTIWSLFPIDIDRRHKGSPLGQ